MPLAYYADLEHACPRTTLYIHTQTAKKQRRIYTHAYLLLYASVALKFASKPKIVEADANSR